MQNARNHSGLLPPAELSAWLAGQSENLPETLSFSGQSLKYFRNDLPVAVLSTDAAGLERLATAFAPEGAGAAAVVGQRTSRGEVKLFVELDGVEFHLLFRDQDWLADSAVLSLDRLHLDLDASDWSGARPDLDDLEAERLRPVAPEDLGPDDAFRLGALAAMTDFEPDATGMETLRPAFAADARVAPDKTFLRKQFQKIVLGRRPSRGFEVLREIGALDLLLPELSAGIGLSQNRYHSHDIYYHSIYACDSAERDITLRLSALFHDLGKVDTREVHENGEASFHNHEIVSTRHTENIMRRLGFPGQLKKRVKFLVRNHMFHYTNAWSDRAVRRFMKKVSMEQLEDLIALRLADRKGSGKRSELPRAIKTLIRHIETVKARDAELKIKDLEIDGNRLQAMGMAPGPAMGHLLKELLEEVKAERLPNEAGVLEAEARRRLEPASSSVAAGSHSG